MFHRDHWLHLIVYSYGEVVGGTVSSASHHLAFLTVVCNFIGSCSSAWRHIPVPSTMGLKKKKLCFFFSPLRCLSSRKGSAHHWLICVMFCPPVPLVSRMCPSDVCRIWKSGSNLRVDATLLGFENMTWIRGRRSYIFRGDGELFAGHPHGVSRGLRGCANVSLLTPSG